MPQRYPRLRMFAGPNGSGKSTIKSVISPQLLGVYIDPDEIEKKFRETNRLDLHAYEIKTSSEEFLNFLRGSSLLKNVGLLAEVTKFRVIDHSVTFQDLEVNAYFASATADFIRNKLLATQKSFTFETVMSFPDKVEFLRKAQGKGYRTYLYYVATEDPEINISRVRNRVKLGGHSVPEEKIVSRYYLSLELLMDAVRSTNRAYIFDNSNHEQIWLAEVTDGRILEMKTSSMPAWFKKALWDKFEAVTKGSS